MIPSGYYAEYDEQSSGCRTGLRMSGTKKGLLSGRSPTHLELDRLGALFCLEWYFSRCAIVTSRPPANH